MAIKEPVVGVSTIRIAVTTHCNSAGATAPVLACARSNQGLMVKLCLMAWSSFRAYHLSTFILKCLGMNGEGADQLLWGEVHLNLPVVALHHHLVKVTLGVRVHPLACVRRLLLGVKCRNMESSPLNLGRTSGGYRYYASCEARPFTNYIDDLYPLLILTPERLLHMHQST